MDHAINLLVSAILTLAALVMEAVGLADAFLAALMTRVGVPQNAQIILLVVAAIWLTVMAFRLFGRIFAALIIVLLILLILHRLLPHPALPVTPPTAGAVHI
jgi:drug/metabolite transporter superfamily protein YnfA